MGSKGMGKGRRRGVAVVGLLGLLLLGSLLMVPVAQGLPRPAGGLLTPPNPYLVFGYVWQPASTNPASGATVFVNDTSAAFALAPVVADTQGRFQVDLSQGSSAYHNLDTVTVQSVWSGLTGTNSTTVHTNQAGSWCNNTLTIAPLTAGLVANPATVYAGTPVNLTATASGGAPPYQFNWTLGDGTPEYTSGHANYTVHTFGVAGTFTPWVWVNGTVGRNASTSASLTVLPAPTLALTYSPASPQVNDTVVLKATLSLGGTGWQYFFTFGDGSSSGYLPPGVNTTTHAYIAAGSYPVNATAYNTTSGYAVQSPVATVVVAAGIAVALSVAPSPTEVGVNTTLTAAASNSRTSVQYTFAFGDGGTAGPGGATVVHAYSAPGAVTAMVTATNATGASAVRRTSLTVDPALTVGLAASATSGSAPLRVTFTATGAQGIAPYSYNFSLGNGVILLGNTSGTATTTYTTPGTYTAVVLARDSLGARALAVLTVTVTPVVPPSLAVNARASPTSGTAPLAVALTGFATGGVPAYSFVWAFGDGASSAPSADPHTNHTYSAAGTYRAYLNVTDSASPAATASASVSITVTAPSVQPLVATLTGPTSGTAGTAMTFSVNLSGGVPPYTMAWRFGDGGSATPTAPLHEVNETYTYAAAGSYVIHVWVNDSAGTSRALNLPVTIVAAPGPTPSTPTLIDQLLPGGGLFPWLLLLLIVLVGIIVIVAALRRRKPKPAAEPWSAEGGASSSEPAGPTGEAEIAPETNAVGATAAVAATATPSTADESAEGEEPVTWEELAEDGENTSSEGSPSEAPPSDDGTPEGGVEEAAPSEEETATPEEGPSDDGDAGPEEAPSEGGAAEDGAAPPEEDGGAGSSEDPGSDPAEGDPAVDPGDDPSA